MENQHGIQFTGKPGTGDGSDMGNGNGNGNGKVKGRWIGLFIQVVAVAVMIGVTFAAVAGATFVYRLYETLPTHSKLQNVEQAVVSKVMDKDGNLIHEFSVERRFWVPLDEIPVELQNAVIAIEDRKFYDHWGIDMQRNFGAIIANLTRGRRAQGASTLTQQLARNLYLTSDKSFIRKIREILTAVQLERSYTKREILELYLNQVYLGAGVYGVQAAADHYFSKNVSDLTLGECAVIAGAIQTPERFRPDRPGNIENITVRRNTVLQSMVITKAIDKETAKAASSEPVVANPKEYRPPAAPYFMEMVRKYVSDKYGDDLLYNGGLVIHTTLDPVAQDATEKSVAKQVTSLQNRLKRVFLDESGADRKAGIPRDRFLANFDSLYALKADEYNMLPDSVKLRQAQMGVASIDVKTGAIRVMIGGRDFQESKFNRVMQARRQAGSVFKSYVYSAAMENGLSPATVLLDQPITLMDDGKEWRPENYDRNFSGPLTVRTALAKSNNLIAIQVFQRIGGQTVVDYAQKMGIRQPLHTGPSLAIGACEITPMEILTSHAIFANRGVQAEPYFIRKILDKNGKTLEETKVKEKTVLSPQVAFIMNSLLSHVVCCGTAAPSRSMGFTRPAGGKTGTTNDYTDAWFVGYTPQIATVVWAGVDERRSLGYGVTGGLVSVPVWVDAMIALHKGLPVADFARPEGVKSQMVCAQSFGLATSSCPNTRAEVFLASAEHETCRVHGGTRSLLDGGTDDLFGPSRRSNRTDATSGGAQTGDSKKKGESAPKPKKRNMF